MKPTHYTRESLRALANASGFGAVLPSELIDFLCTHQDRVRSALEALQEGRDPDAAPILWELYQEARRMWPIFFARPLIADGVFDLAKARRWLLRLLWLVSFGADREQEARN